MPEPEEAAGQAVAAMDLYASDSLIDDILHWGMHLNYNLAWYLFTSADVSSIALGATLALHGLLTRLSAAARGNLQPLWCIPE